MHIIRYLICHLPRKTLEAGQYHRDWEKVGIFNTDFEELTALISKNSWVNYTLLLFFGLFWAKCEILEYQGLKWTYMDTLKKDSLRYVRSAAIWWLWTKKHNLVHCGAQVHIRSWGHVFTISLRRKKDFENQTKFDRLRGKKCITTYTFKNHLKLVLHISLCLVGTTEVPEHDFSNPDHKAITKSW